MRGQRAIILHADLVVLLGGPAPVHRDEIFLAREFELHGHAGVLGQHRGHQIEILALILVAEAAAHVLADHAHLLRAAASGPGDVRAAIGNALRGGVDGQLVALPIGDADARFELRVVDVDVTVVVFENLIGGGEAFVDVAALCRSPARAAPLSSGERLPPGWISGAPGFSASSGSSTNGSIS